MPVFSINEILIKKIIIADKHSEPLLYLNLIIQLIAYKLLDIYYFNNYLIDKRSV